MKVFLQQSWHYLSGLAVIGAVSALTANGNVSGSAGLAVITGIGGALIGGGISNVASLVGGSTTPPTPPVA